MSKYCTLFYMTLAVIGMLMRSVEDNFEIILFSISQ